MKLALILGMTLLAGPPAKPTPSPSPSLSPSPVPLPSPSVTASPAPPAPQPLHAEHAAVPESILPRVGAIPGDVIDPPEPDAPAPPHADKSAWGNRLDPRDVAATSPDPATRRYMAAVMADQNDVHSFVMLTQLAQDSDTAVRHAALNAAWHKRCKHEPATLCNALLASFMRDTEREIAWQARDWLLDRDMELALEDADKDYKLDLLAKLGGSPTVPQGPARHLLRCLSADADLDIQDNAAWLLEQQP